MSKSLPSFATRSSPQRRTSSHTPVLNYCGFAGLLCKISLGNLMDPDQRTPSENDYQGVGNPLQPRQASLLSRPWITGPTQDSVPKSGHRHQLPGGYRVVKDSVLGWLHHEYRLVKEAALRTSFPFADDSYELRANYLSSRSSNLSVSAVTVTST